MMGKIPEHIRENHENTSEILHKARSLMLALSYMADARSVPNTPENESLHVLIATVQGMLAEADKAHTVEWVGFGGNSEQLTPEETAAARGEDGGAA